MQYITLDARGTLIKVPSSIINKSKVLSKSENLKSYYLNYSGDIVHKMIDFLYGYPMISNLDSIMSNLMDELEITDFRWLSYKNKIDQKISHFIHSICRLNHLFDYTNETIATKYSKFLKIEYNGKPHHDLRLLPYEKMNNIDEFIDTIKKDKEIVDNLYKISSIRNKYESLMQNFLVSCDALVNALDKLK